MQDLAEFRARYEREGAVWPIPIFSAEEIAHYRNKLDEAMTNLSLMSSDYRCKSQVLFPWVAEIAKSPRLTPYLQCLLGDDYHCWDTLFWVKQPGDNKRVSFHQDGTYWNFEPEKGLTVWLSFDGSTEQKGSIQYVIKPHERRIRHHEDRASSDNLLMRGQTLDRDEEELMHTRIAEIPAGSIAVHSPFILHGSMPNLTAEPRRACGFLFVRGDAKPRATYARESTLWIRGRDPEHFSLDPLPTGDWELDVESWRNAYDRQHENYYKMRAAHA